MTELHLPWLELTILLPALGALLVSRLRDARATRVSSLGVMLATLLCASAAWLDLSLLSAFEAHDRWDVLTQLFGRDILVVDQLSAPLLPLTALVFLAALLTTARTKEARFSFAGALISEAIVLATLSCKAPWGVIALLAVGVLPPLYDLRQRGASTRVFVAHMGLFCLLLVGGQWIVEAPEATRSHELGVAMLTAAVLLRSGVAPVHCWMTDLFENASFGTALLFVTPMTGAYGAVRLVLPIASNAALRSIALASLFTAVYAAGMALVQREGRRFFCYLFLSHASLVLVGMETATAVGLTGALSVWISVALALTGFGLSLRSIEARAGRMSLAAYHGLYDRVPELAVFFLLTGLASVGFPGTIGFVATELLVDGVVQTYPLVGMAIVLAAALNGIAVLQVYFRIFTGARNTSSVSLRGKPNELLAVALLTMLILGGGLLPQPGIASRYAAAVEIMRSREPTERAAAREEAADDAEDVPDGAASDLPVD